MRYLLFAAILFFPALVSAQRLEIGPGAGIDPIVIHTQGVDSGVIEIYIGSNATAGSIQRIFLNEDNSVDSVKYSSWIGRSEHATVICYSKSANINTTTKEPLAKGAYILFKYRIFRRKA